MLTYHSDNERKDCIYMGTIHQLDALINLPETIKEEFKKKKSGA